MGVKVHGLPLSTCTSRVLTILHEKGLDFELLPVNLLAGEHKQPSFLAKNVTTYMFNYHIPYILRQLIDPSNRYL